MKSLLSCFIVITCFFSSAYAAHKTSPPNVIIILCDDLGYGDLSCQGHPVIKTPNIDKLAAEGQRWTSFYASAPLCNPSRVAMMTGRMPIRINKTNRNQWSPIYIQCAICQSYQSHILVSSSVLGVSATPT